MEEEMRAWSPRPYQCGEDGAGLVVVDDEGEAAAEVLDDLVRRVRPAVAKSPVGLDDEEGFVGGLAQSVLLYQSTEVVKAPEEEAVDVVETTEQPAQRGNPKSEEPRTARRCQGIRSKRFPSI